MHPTPTYPTLPYPAQLNTIHADNYRTTYLTAAIWPQEQYGTIIYSLLTQMYKQCNLSNNS